MIPISEHAPPDRVLKWVVESVGPGAIIESVSRLHGGMSSLVYSVSLQVDHIVKDFVVRQFDNAEWLREEPDLALHEAECLRLASRIGLPTPEIVAFDKTGSDCNVPSVLMTKLEGSINLRPLSMEQWLNGLAEALGRIHTVDADDFPWTYFTYNDINSLETPSWSSHPEQWNEVIRIVKGPRPQTRQCFIHRDYHPTNVLWTGTKVSGVVDWVNACRGPAGIDVGHCRLNLAMLFGVPTADEFLSAYESHAGTTFRFNPYWDLISLIEVLCGPPQVYPGWTALGVKGLTDELMAERLDIYMLSLLERV